MKAVLALTLCLMASCAGLRSRSSSSLVGEWRYADKIQACHYVFNRDGGFRGEVIYHAKLISKFTGKWSVDGDTLFYIYSSDELGRIPAGATDRDKLLSVDRDFFVIEAADGDTRRIFHCRVLSFARHLDRIRAESCFVDQGRAFVGELDRPFGELSVETVHDGLSLPWRP